MGNVFENNEEVNPNTATKCYRMEHGEWVLIAEKIDGKWEIANGDKPPAFKKHPSLILNKEETLTTRPSMLDYITTELERSKYDG